MPLFPFTTFGASRASNTPSTPSCDFTYCYGGDWVQGKVGNYGVKLISSDSPKNYIDINNYSDIHALEKGTVAMWVNPNISGEYYPTLVAAGDNDVSDTYFEFYINQTDSKVKYAHYNAGSSTTNILNNTAITPNTWNHVALTSDGTTAKIYLNGVNNTATNYGYENNGDWFADNSGLDNLTLGIMEYNGGTLSFPYSGSMDEVAIWDVPLTDAQISLLSTGSARADSITPPAVSDGQWGTGYIGEYAIEFTGTMAPPAVGPNQGWISSSQAANTAVGGLYDDFTMGGWFKFANPGGNTYSPMITNRGLSGPVGWTLTRAGDNPSDTYDNKISLLVQNGGAYRYWHEDVQTPTDTWVHIVAGINSSTPFIYKNGELQSGDAGSGSPTLSSAIDVLSFGRLQARDSDYNGFFASGSMDEVAIWDVVLDAGAIDDWHSGTLPSAISSSNLQLYYDMTDGPGSSTLTDKSGNGYDGTFQRMDAGTTGSLLLYYDFEIGDSNPVSGNFHALGHPTSASVYDVVTASFHGPTAHTGTMTNMSVADFGAWGQGKIGKYSFLCDGIDDSIEIASSSYLPLGDGNESFSISLWANNTEALDESYEALVGRHRLGASSFTDGYSLRYNGTDQDELDFRIGKWATTGPVASCDWDRGIDLTFRHVVATYDHVADESKIYLDGVIGNTNGAKATGTTIAGTHNTRIGRGGTNESYTWPGNIDEVAFYNVALDSGAISDLYNSGQGAKANTVSSSALVCYLDMECDGPGSTNVLDLSGNDLSGTLNADAGTCGAG